MVERRPQSAVRNGRTAHRGRDWLCSTLLDAILLLSPERAIPRLLARMRLLTDGGEDGEKWWSAHATAAEGDSPWSSWCNHHEWCRDNNVVRAVVGYQRLAALPAAPAPIQFLIDKSVEYFLPTQGKKIRALPTVGDFLLEGALMQAFIAEFLFSAKVVGLVLSILKAHRVRRAAEELRRESACRSVVHFFRRVVISSSSRTPPAEGRVADDAQGRGRFHAGRRIGFRWRRRQVE